MSDRRVGSEASDVHEPDVEISSALGKCGRYSDVARSVRVVLFGKDPVAEAPMMQPTSLPLSTQRTYPELAMEGGAY